MDLFKLQGVVEIDTGNAKSQLSDVSNTGQQTQSKLGKVFSGIGKGAAVVGKAIGTGLMVGGTAMAGLTKKSLDAVGELQQNMGGSEAVFAQYARNMQDTAKKAFSSMGLSTSDYLATANKMGSLFQGAGFSIEESMNLSSGAMQRASDVASIMGIDTSSAMEAIAGAAKGNFTMMDNLGVAMNATTIEAYALSKGCETAYKDMDNQTKIGYAMQMFMEKTAYATGNYAKENETLSGSLTTVKAALTNFLDGSGDVDNLVNAFIGAANSIMGSLDSILPRLVSGISEIVNKIVPMLPGLLEKVLPGLLTAAKDLIVAFVDAVPQILDILIDMLPDLIAAVKSIVIALCDAIPQLLETILAALPELLPMLIDAAIDIILSIVSNFDKIIQPLIDHLPEIIISVMESLMSNLPALIDGIISLVMGIVENIPIILQALVDAIPTVISLIVEALCEAIPDLVVGLGQVVWGIVQSLPEIFGSLCEGIVNVFIGIWDGVTAAFPEFEGWLKDTWQSLVDFFSGLWDGVKAVWQAVVDWFDRTVQSICGFFADLRESVKSVWNNIKNSVSNAVNNVKDKVSNVFDSLKDKVSSVWKKIKDAISKPIEDARDKVKDVVDKIKGFFDKLDIKLPKIKLPHFSIDGKLSLNPPSVPKLKIDWYAQGGILTKPTIFDYNPANNTAKVGGEAGEEAIAPISTLQGYVSTAVRSENGAVVEMLQFIADLLIQFFPEALEKMERPIVLDSGVLVSELTPGMNMALGKLSIGKGRGR